MTARPRTYVPVRNAQNLPPWNPAVQVQTFASNENRATTPHQTSLCVDPAQGTTHMMPLLQQRTMSLMHQSTQRARSQFDLLIFHIFICFCGLIIWFQMLKLVLSGKIPLRTFFCLAAQDMASWQDSFKFLDRSVLAGWTIFLDNTAP